MQKKQARDSIFGKRRIGKEERKTVNLRRNGRHKIRPLMLEDEREKNRLGEIAGL